MIDIDPEMAPLAGTSPPGPNIRTAGPGPMRAVLAFLSPTGGPEMAAETDYAIGGVAVRDYRPGDAPAGTILLFHGGGWTLGSVAEYDCFARTMAAATGCRVVSAEYRLAPEHPFPAAVEDALTVLNGLTSDGPLFVAGDSAGGNLAAVMAQQARKSGGPALAGQILIYPSVAGDAESEAMHAFAPPMMPREDIAAYYDLYIPDHAQRSDPRFAPLNGRLEDLPPAFVVTASADLLAAEGEQYARALEGAGNDVTLRRQEGALHAYFTLLPDSRAARETMDALAAFVARRVRDIAGSEGLPAASVAGADGGR